MQKIMVLSWKPIIFHALCKRLDFFYDLFSFLKLKKRGIVFELTMEENYENKI